MTPEILNHMMRDPEGFLRDFESSPAGLMFWVYYWQATHPQTAWALVLIYAASLLVSVIHILGNFRGPDRICWLLVVMLLPVAGMPIYWLMGLNECSVEREQNWLDKLSGKPSSRA